MENKPTFREAMLYWLKLGFISFGGPAGQIAMMHRELVEKRKWVSDEKFSHALSFCMLLPGPEAQQLATYNGWLMHGVKGGIVAGVLFILPSIFVLLAISYIYAKFGDIREVSGILDGIKAVVVAIVVEAVWKIGKKAFKKNWHIAVAALSFISIYFLHVPFPLIVLCAAIIGLLIPNSKAQTPHPTETSVSRSPQSAIAKTFLTCLGLWLIPFLSILFTLGFKSLPMKIYLFFSQAAFVTFGGAYSVLAYVNQYAVTTYGWITAQQAIDGFGLAETTPGPLIMVLQFIGFMAGWNNVDNFNPASYAVLCALLTTFATFLPSFFFIFAFAPIIERFENNEKLKGALSGVTAAVVGVILNLALAFGFAVIYHNNQVNWFAFGLSLTSLIILFRFKIDVLWIVIGGGILGLIKTFFY
jgi:chromate transporter